MPLIAQFKRSDIVRIESLVWQTERHALITFDHAALKSSAAGTFCMVWVPGVDEVPMGTGPNIDGKVSLCIEAKGDCTSALLELGVGGKIGIRGPYGRGFDLSGKNKKICFLGGGTGIAPMARGAKAAADWGHEVTLISGARSKALVLMDEWMQQNADEDLFTYYPCTNDGSFGFAGFTTQKLEELLKSGKFDLIVACGPEAMMVAAKVVADKHKIPYQASLERYMKCAVGICDACTIGEGERVCLEGPVFNGEKLATIAEFGVGHRDASGILHPW